jgi:hypothetical protein
MQSDYTLNLLNPNDDYHTDIIRSKLVMRNIDNTFKEVHEEIVMAISDLIPTHEDST